LTKLLFTAKSLVASFFGTQCILDYQSINCNFDKVMLY